MRNLIFFALIAFGLSAQAELPKDVTCQGIVAALNGPTTRGVLTQMPEDALMGIWKQNQYSFVVDFFNYAHDGSMRLYIHDTKADYTAVGDGVMKVIGQGANQIALFEIQQVIGYESNNPITLTLDCWKSTHATSVLPASQH